MSQFLSKIQHDSYEKGEFSDEQIRTAEETIKLIRNFPWDNERTLTDIQLTGPSITICDEDVNYLKIGLYFNSKYCLYYLDCENHLYEYHASDIDVACNMVTNYFNQTLDLQPFEKHFFNVGNQAHFVTSYFEYRVKTSRFLMLSFFLLVYIAVFFGFFFRANFHSAVLFFPAFIILLTGGVLTYTFFKYLQQRNQYLQISKGNNKFSFGQDEEHITSYDKADVKEITLYESRGSRNPNLVEVFEVVFKNGDTIKLSNMLISSYVFLSKFTDKTDQFTVPLVYGKKNPLKIL